MTKFRKRPIEVEAFQLGVDNIPEWFEKAQQRNIAYLKKGDHLFSLPQQLRCSIFIAGNEVIVKYGDYIIKGDQGVVYPIKQKKFEEEYEKVGE